eukprot:1160479-Pelagomonas_calceolata.AAC.9
MSCAHKRNKGLAVAISGAVRKAAHDGVEGGAGTLCHAYCAEGCAQACEGRGRHILSCTRRLVTWPVKQSGYSAHIVKAYLAQSRRVHTCCWKKI